MRHIPDTDGDWQQCAGYRKKVLLTEIDLNAPGTLVQIVEIAPRTAVAAHFHDHCTEVFHVTSGRGRFVIGGNTVDLEPGAPSLRYHLALALDEAGDEARAKEMLQAALDAGTFPELETAQRKLKEYGQR